MAAWCGTLYGLHEQEALVSAWYPVPAVLFTVREMGKHSQSQSVYWLLLNIIIKLIFGGVLLLDLKISLK